MVEGELVNDSTFRIFTLFDPEKLLIHQIFSLKKSAEKRMMTLERKEESK